MSQYVRKFQVKLEGQEEPILVGSLTTVQTEEFLERQATALQNEDKKAQSKQRLVNLYTMIADGLNNVATNGNPKWSVELIKTTFDQQQVDAMMDMIMQKSGLLIPKGTSTEPS